MSRIGGAVLSAAAAMLAAAEVQLAAFPHTRPEGLWIYCAGGAAFAPAAGATLLARAPLPGAAAALLLLGPIGGAALAWRDYRYSGEALSPDECAVVMEATKVLSPLQRLPSTYVLTKAASRQTEHRTEGAKSRATR